MKYLIVFCVCVLSCLAEIKLPPEIKTAVVGIHKECAAEGNISDELIQQAMTGDIPEDDAMKQHLLCISKKLGFIGDNGEINTDIVKEHASMILDDPVKLDGFMSKCLEHKSTPADTAHAGIKCFIEIYRT